MVLLLLEIYIPVWLDKNAEALQRGTELDKIYIPVWLDKNN